MGKNFGNPNINTKLSMLIEESASFIRRYIDDLQMHKQRQEVLEQIVQGAEGLHTPGEVYRPFSSFAPVIPIEQASGNEPSLQLLIKGRQ
ncbi:MAG: hypothetical protein RML40_04455 [Bacteroidota bacterium]|nr:hypothetical protein [Candidatus Kapabacteria bacterium]MDW8219761.1 hypothetical protein [Bacteroidota bacterium]